jgi:hypothetical protein
LAVAVIVALRMTSMRSNARSAIDSVGLVRITPQRIVVSPRSSTLCFRPPPAGPHDNTAEIHIFANQTALDYRCEHPNEYDYPIGSKFVKEKYSQAGDASPDAATIMERRSAKGDVSDWDFSIVALPEKTPLKSDGEVSCASCHEGYKDTGYISYESESALKMFLATE